MGKAYTGRLAFDPETNFHVDEEGVPVVTEDGGKSWRYADDNDTSHFDRYHERVAVVDGTANRLMELELEHGREKAEKLMRDEQPHHYEVHEDDRHMNGITSVPDHKSATATGHTEAYANAS